MPAYVYSESVIKFNNNNNNNKPYIMTTMVLFFYHYIGDIARNWITNRGKC